MTAQEKEETVKAFTDQCVWLRLIYNEFRYLFNKTNESRVHLLEEVASNFFHDLNKIFIDYLLLGICKLTDPAHYGKNDRYENLSVEYILELVGQPTANQLGLDQLSKKIHSIRDRLRAARNKILAHSDKHIMISQKVIGAFPKETGDDFWSNLQEFVNGINNHYFRNGPYPLDAVNPSGAEDLVRALKKSVHYDDFFKGKSRQKLEERNRMRYKDA
jgi:hypothetical protein